MPGLPSRVALFWLLIIKKRSLAAARLEERGIVVLGVARDDGTHLGAPRRDTELRVGDVLTVYGREEIDAQRLRAGPPIAPDLPIMRR